MKRPREKILFNVDLITQSQTQYEPPRYQCMKAFYS